MSVWFVIVSMVAAANPARLAVSLSATARPDRRMPLVIGSAISLLALLVLAVLATPLLDVLDITDETWRIGAGAIAVLAAARRLVFLPASPLPPLDGAVHAVAPVAFPAILVPELVALVVLYGATESFGLTAVAAVIGVGSGAAGGTAGDSPTTRGAVRALAALLVVAGVALIVAGIRDV